MGRGVPKDGDDGETVSSVDGETSKEGRRGAAKGGGVSEISGDEVPKTKACC